MKILFIYQDMLSFVRKDLEILQSRHELKSVRFQGLKDLFPLVRDIIWADQTLSWFGKLHAFFAVLLSKVLGKKSIVVAGGDDVACETQGIKYGMFAFWWKKWCPLFIFRYADLILPVSAFNKEETIRNAKANTSKVKLIYHGFDSLEFYRIQDIAKEPLVITVGGVNWGRYERKGFERFVRSAAFLPEIQFALIGQWHDNSIDRLKAVASENVMFTGRVSDEELEKWFSRSKVYVQVSIHEGFGCSIAEAMLCECIPVVSNRAAIPEVVGDCGFYVDELSPEKIAKKIREALDAPDVLGKKARERIMTIFPFEKRKKELLKAIEDVSTYSH